MGGARLLGGVLAATFGVAAACGEAVAPVPASPTLKFCPTVALPTWFAYQNEGQPWVQLPAGTASFSFEPARRLTIAYATDNPSGAGGGATVWIASVTAEELNDFQCPFPRGDRRLTGSVMNWQVADEFVALAMGPQAKTAEPESPTFVFSTLSDAPIDLVAEVASTPRRIVIRRDVMANSGTTLPPLDIASSEVKPTAQFIVNLEPADAPRVTRSYYFLTANGTAFHFVDGLSLGTPNQSVPHEMTRSGDVHAVSFLSGVSPEPTRYVANFFRQTSDRTLTLGALLGLPTFDVVSATPYLRLHMTLASQPEYSTFVHARYVQATPNGGTVSVHVLVSAAYVGRTPAAWDVSIPDLTSAPGFDVNWMLKSGFPSDWTVEASSGLPFWRSTRPKDGLTVRTATRQSTLAP